MRNVIPRWLWIAIPVLSLAMACGDEPDQDGSGSGGRPGTGGGTRTGGTPSSGGSSGTGGALGSGGRTALGGVAPAGGRTGTGGIAVGTGGSGTTGPGGTKATGGMGGTTATGGSPATGGVIPTGGAVPTGGNQDAGSTSHAGGATGAGGSTHGGQWRIMPLGDSITDTTCYPKLLAQELIDKGRTNFTFVGTSLNNQSCGTAPNVQTEGHGCYLVTNLLKDVTTVPGCGGTKGSLAELLAWAAQKPDVVLMEYGTNDAWSSIATTEILKAYSGVVDEFRAQNPNVIFFVAQITPLNPSGCSTCEANVEALNAQIPTWAIGKSTTASPIHVVDVWASLPAASYTPNSTYTSDGCHPNAAGSQKMAEAWYAGLVAQGIP